MTSHSTLSCSGKHLIFVCVRFKQPSRENNTYMWILDKLTLKHSITFLILDHHGLSIFHLSVVHRHSLRIADPVEGFFHGPDERDEVQRQLIIKIRAVIIPVVEADSIVAASDHRVLLLLAEHEPAHRALPVALHPRHQAVVVEHVVARRHQHLLVRHE
ncbi:hypothetical protein Cni_G00119 [Canna indica]|uniref:Uncharacterized protein n=1 Tax=Canna indica TaxID=4628 RepID=A0AAQ3JKM2_9LILI|nr:hypothetical protein Cni_G00119 [Canna indica]